MVKIQEEILQRAGAHHLFIQFHGAYKPIGRRFAGLASTNENCCSIYGGDQPPDNAECLTPPPAPGYQRFDECPICGIL
ncbi:hypothetical protein HK413_08735 [Mucilaginibacter sp. S1162]|uniref:Uncharacterized protein n=1 Tax=Mucilaginibacter humi TaxID=2732510 RepID=A0ABX1W258_9SPHI|nr:hypothetical protein [Mucilaginibacter humi]